MEKRPMWPSNVTELGSSRVVALAIVVVSWKNSQERKANVEHAKAITPSKRTISLK